MAEKLEAGNSRMKNCCVRQLQPLNDLVQFGKTCIVSYFAKLGIDRSGVFWQVTIVANGFSMFFNKSTIVFDSFLFKFQPLVSMVFPMVNCT